MNLDDLRQIEDELARNRALYEEVFDDEQGRLHSQATSVERLTTLRVLGEELKNPASVLDLGCGAGVYALPLAKQGHQVLATDPVPRHIRQLQEGIREEMRITARCQDALSTLKSLPDASRDAVLCLGPMYHMHDRGDRIACLAHLARVLKPGGRAFLAFINNDWVIATMTLVNAGADYLISGDYDKVTFRLDDFPFQFHTLSQAREEIRAGGLRLLREIASDGIAEMHSGQIAGFSPEQFAQWLRYHEYLCEKPEFLGASNHWLMVCEKA